MTSLTKNSWLEYSSTSDFSIHNIPFGIASIQGGSPRGVTRIGDYIIDLSAWMEAGLFDDLNLPKPYCFHETSLNEFISMGKAFTVPLRKRIQEVLSEGKEEIQSNGLEQESIFSVDQAKMLMPVEVGDYTDFYSSKAHATNVGTMFRDPDNALLPNWKHIPVGYHGRASSIVVSGTPLHRPKGQTLPEGSDTPVFGPTKRLDFELEMAFITQGETQLGDRIPVEHAESHIFGFVLFNDWSARDIQKWEYVPLGPFLAKNFGSSISPWIVTLEAFDPFRTAGPKQEPQPLDYLKVQGQKNIDIQLEVAIEAEGSPAHPVCRSNFKYMYWNVAQQLAHHTVNGCNIKTGDMYASGTISGPTPESYGSMLELAWKGTKPIKMPDGSERKFIEDGDTVIMKGFAEKSGIRVGFGEVSTKILPAK